MHTQTNIHTAAFVDDLEAAVSASSLHVPRLVGPYNALASPLAIEFTAVSEILDAHTSRAS